MNVDFARQTSSLFAVHDAIARRLRVSPTHFYLTKGNHLVESVSQIRNMDAVQVFLRGGVSY